MNRTIVFTNGCFDILHVGHFNLLSYCRELAGNDGRVIVALDSDLKIKTDKGDDRPFFSWEERSSNLYKLSRFTNKNRIPIVDNVLSFSTNKELHEHIRQVTPNIIVKGDDWEGNVVGSDLVQNVILFPRIYSSTRMVERIQSKHKCAHDMIEKYLKETDKPDQTASVTIDKQKIISTYDTPIQCTCGFNEGQNHAPDCYYTLYIK